MTLPLDHVVILVKDLDAALAGYRALGFNAFPGGEHPGGRSHNALVVFEDGAYLELIAYRRPAPEVRWWRMGEADGEGLVDFGLLPEDTGAVVTRARAAGVDVEGPLEGGRERPDGVRLEWRVGRPAEHDLPFLCGDVTPRAHRVPEGEVRHHPNGVVGVAAITVAVVDIARSAARWQAYLGLAEAPAVETLPGLGIATATISLVGTRIVLAAATDPLQAAGAEISASIAARGQGPYAVAFAGSPSSAVTLDRKRAHGARLEIVPASVRPQAKREI
jgi:catechol 2,3-dioxygenase-like lactoylglutathione lyase family enzyme